MTQINNKGNKSKHRWALITGASSGIGLAYAWELAQSKQSLILVARNRGKLHEISEELSKRYGIAVKVIAADLSTSQGVEHVINETEGMSVELLINNAGKEESGEFLKLNTADMLSSIALNCSAPMLLSHHFARKMAENGGGRILFLSSIVAFQGVPLISNYAATKAYLLTFAEGLAAEVQDKGVDIAIAAPGFTDTNLASDMNFDNTPIKPMEAMFVACYTLEKLGKQRIIIPGFINKFLFYSGKYLQTRRINTTAFGKVFKQVLSNKLNKTQPKEKQA
ncbi:SDR family NAD(P)-dependent oxidoreductase [Thalassomonas sp. RHCl1]|uniref:SDR family NAD(P)-dependent oxidoreductase n=1 Tax=Thalassomonas sp. RHCl1 TaxID=2995320 RepID=UPI00248A9228|nr:SDR family NAD(P)-dependent oxidoreductase [Thalassomonas sp. RHCl1]